MNSNFELKLGYLNPALNNTALGGSVFAKSKASSITWSLINNTINIEDDIDQLSSSFRCTVDHFPSLVLSHVT